MIDLKEKTSETRKKELLEKARKHCFFVGLNDSGAELCKINTPYGIAAIQYLQEKLGLAAKAAFISSPDMTITRNVSRWKSGLGYGGKLLWGDGTDELIILNAKPNACGMLVGGIDKIPEIDTLIKRLHEMEADTQVIEGIPVEWDFYKSNHFIDLFEVKQVAGDAPPVPKYAFVLHGSAGELRKDNKTGVGIYYDKSKILAETAQKMETPFGTVHYLTGEKARDYYRQYNFVQDFAHKKRSLAGRILFGEYTEICNETHQGLVSMNSMVLGCHHLKNSGALFPVTLRPDLPAYLVRGVPNYSPDTIEVLGFESRARKLGVYDYLLNADILPHGGGYVLPDILSANRVIEVNGSRYFEVEMQNDRGKQIISEVHELPYEYRGRTVILRSIEIGSLEIVFKLIPRFVLKM